MPTHGVDRWRMHLDLEAPCGMSWSWLISSFERTHLTYRNLCVPCWWISTRNLYPLCVGVESGEVDESSLQRVGACARGHQRKSSSKGTRSWLPLTCASYRTRRPYCWQAWMPVWFLLTSSCRLPSLKNQRQRNKQRKSPPPAPSRCPQLRYSWPNQASLACPSPML